MAWTYDPSVRSNRNRVRERVGDTEVSDRLVSDEAIDEALADHPAVTRAAAQVARLVLARLMRAEDRVVDGVSVTRARIDAMERLIERLDAEAGGNTPRALMRAGGTSIATEDRYLNDPDYEPVSAGWLDERVR
jgi:hypothetical protein